MGPSTDRNLRVAVPNCHFGFGVFIFVVSVGVLIALDARASEFDTIASALGLYSASLLGVFSILTSWRNAIVNRRSRYQQVEDKWRIVIDRSVMFSLRGSSVSFLLMLYGVIAPAVKTQIALLLDPIVYSWIARSTSALAISGVVILGLISLQIVRDVTAVYGWNNFVEEQDAIVQAQRDTINESKSVKPY
ncbi:hypothetical protein [Glutamicibacter sp. BW77]|uniref:hypothetical protein n=1 Tax=Glutamicibacter TaxID=1742989 RepID=UPI000BB6987F|nr:hypothetical protein [Glutamicibacter sp. BW77]PCC37291.1 hypothetical protein CIK74_01355 [Glutamicibacter sp. BW77]